MRKMTVNPLSLPLSSNTQSETVHTNRYIIHLISLCGKTLSFDPVAKQVSLINYWGTAMVAVAYIQYLYRKMAIKWLWYIMTAFKSRSKPNQRKQNKKQYIYL